MTKGRVYVRVTDPKQVGDLGGFLPADLLAEIEREVLSSGGDAVEEGVGDEVAATEPIVFDFGLVNSNHDLKTLIKKLKKSKQLGYGMLFYGVSGSGKSYLGKYFAQECGYPLLKKRASDLQDRYVGQTEANIRKAFVEAREKKAVLLIDEADSFLFDRRFAKQDFQVSHVNEMLTQMEDHPYPVIMTTNLKSNLDKAAMRRFVFKIKFDYMTAENVQAGVKNYFGDKVTLTSEQLKTLPNLCAGDFAVARKKMLILEGNRISNKLVYQYLKAEQDEKEIATVSGQIEM